MRNDPHIQQGFAHEFISCNCTRGEMLVHKACCATPSGDCVTIGKKWASPLSGFIAGAVVVSMVVLPWLVILGKEANAGL